MHESINLPILMQIWQIFNTWSLWIPGMTLHDALTLKCTIK